MIESLSLTNFYSFKERTEISFAAGKERNRVSDLKYKGFEELDFVNLLKTVYVYGDNGAGKTKLIKAFEQLSYLVAQTRENKVDSLRYVPFAFDPEMSERNSEIELVYFWRGRRYRYSIEWNVDAIYNEELYIKNSRSEVCLFQRRYNSQRRVVEVDFSRRLRLDDTEKYILVSALLQNNSVLSLMGTTNVYNEELHDQWLFFRQGFEVVHFENIELESSLPDDKTSQGRQLKRLVLDVLKAVGSNIVNYTKIPVQRKIPVAMLERLKRMNADERNELLELFMDSPEFIIKTWHDVGRDRPLELNFSDQSDGTIQILKLLICMQDAILKHKTIILDDCVNGIHPNILNSLQSFFLGAAMDSQLVIVSQNYSFLDMEHIRRDSVRFVSKDRLGESHVGAIQLATLHKNQNLRKSVSTTNQWDQLPFIDDFKLGEVIEYYRNIENSFDEFLY